MQSPPSACANVSKRSELATPLARVAWHARCGLPHHRGWAPPGLTVARPARRQQADRVRGRVTDTDAADVRPFDLDPSAMSALELADALWDKV